MDGSGAPIACTLSARDATTRAEEWSTLLAHVMSRESTDSGVRLRLPVDAEVVAHAASLAVREAECCSFFTFSFTFDASSAWLEVSAPSDAQPIVDALFAERCC